LDGSDDEFALLSPSLMKFLLIKLDKNLPAEPKLDAAFFKKYTAIAGGSCAHLHASR
jgi:hypothetical protein